MNGKVIRVIHDVDFAVLNEQPEFDDEGNAIMRLIDKHGTVVYIAGLVENNPDAIMPFGAEDGSNDYRVAFYKPFYDEMSVLNN